MDLQTATADDFDKLLNEKFTVSQTEAEASDETREIELVLVDRHDRLRKLEGDSKERTRAPFSLLFDSGSNEAFAGGIYSLANDSVGSIDVFLHPVTVASTGQSSEVSEGVHYEVVFA